MTAVLTGGCASSQTPLRRFLVRVAPSRPPRWLTARRAWQLYGLLEWAAYRMQEVAMELDRE